MARRPAPVSSRAESSEATACASSSTSPSPSSIAAIGRLLHRLVCGRARPPVRRGHGRRLDGVAARRQRRTPIPIRSRCWRAPARCRSAPARALAFTAETDADGDAAHRPLHLRGRRPDAGGAAVDADRLRRDRPADGQRRAPHRLPFARDRAPRRRQLRHRGLVRGRSRATGCRSRAVERFKLVLRLYDTPLTTGSQIADLVMPRDPRERAAHEADAALRRSAASCSAASSTSRSSSWCPTTPASDAWAQMKQLRPRRAVPRPAAAGSRRRAAGLARSAHGPGGLPLQPRPTGRCGSARRLPDEFWSVAVFDRRGRNVYSLNDRSAERSRLDLAILTPVQMAQLRQDPPASLETAIVLELPIDVGFALLRVFVPDDSLLAERDGGAARRPTARARSDAAQEVLRGRRRRRRCRRNRRGRPNRAGGGRGRGRAARCARPGR